MGLERNIQPSGLSSFRGLNTKLSEISVANREATKISNIRLDQETIEPRKGNELFTTTQIIEGGVPKAVTGIFQANLGGTIFRVVTVGTKIYSMSAGGGLADITGAVVLADSQNNIMSFAVSIDSLGGDIIVGANGINPPWKWTGVGNAAVLGGSPPGNFKYLLNHKERLWGTDGDFIFHSALRDAESWDVLNFVFRVTDPGFSTNDITGLKSFGDNIVFCKEKSFHMLSGESAITANYLQDINTGDGFISGYSIVEVQSNRHGRLLIGMNRRGELIGFNGTRNIIKISDLIDNTIASGFRASRAPFTTAVLVEDEDNYFVTHSSLAATKHDRFISYNHFLDAFPRSEVSESTLNIDEGFECNFVGLIDIGGQETPVYGTYDGWVLKRNTVNTDVVQADQIVAAPGGLVRTSNTVTLTTLVTHGFTVNDVITIQGTTLSTGATSFNGKFTVLSVGATTLTYTQTAEDATGGDGEVVEKVNVDAVWQSRKNNFTNAGFQKQINDFSLVTSSSRTGQIKTTIFTDKTTADTTDTIQSAGNTWGTFKWGTVKWGGTGTTYTQLKFNTGLIQGLVGRYLKVKFENVDGYQFNIEEYLEGITPLGYQSDLR